MPSVFFVTVRAGGTLSLSVCVCVCVFVGWDIDFTNVLWSAMRVQLQRSLLLDLIWSTSAPLQSLYRTEPPNKIQLSFQSYFWVVQQTLQNKIKWTKGIVWYFGHICCFDFELDKNIDIPLMSVSYCKCGARASYWRSLKDWKQSG